MRREAKPTDVIVELPWPHQLSVIDDPDQRFRDLIQPMCSRAGVALPAAGQEPDAAALREYFQQDWGPRAFWVLVRRKVAICGHAELMQRLLKMWESLGQGLPVVLFVCMAVDVREPQQSGIFSMLRRPSNPPDPDIVDVFRDSVQKHLTDRVGTIGPLARIEAVHLDPWIAELSRRCRTARAGQLAGFKLSLQKLIGDGKRARQFGSDVRAALDELKDETPN